MSIAHATLDTIAADFAATIKTETGADVEFTMTGVDAFSIFTQDGERFPSVVAFLQTVNGVTLDETLARTAADDEDIRLGETGDEFYAFFTHTK